MFKQTKTNNNWVYVSSAMVGGFLLGVSYRKYGSIIKEHVRNMSHKEILDDISNAMHID